jgi:hypothetical protein
MAAVADLEEMTRMWATEKYIGQWDGYAGKDGDPWLPTTTTSSAIPPAASR